MVAPDCDGALRGRRGCVLLYGPAGSGKTLLVQALAAEFKSTFVVIRGPEIFSKWLGDTEEAVRHVFELARRMPPAMVFFDQLEAIAPIRGSDAGSGTADRVVGQLLTELDELEIADRVLVIGATNRPDLIDSSVRRAGRLGLQIEIPLPELPDRRAHIAVLVRETGLHVTAADIDWLAEQTAGYSGADLRSLASVLQMQWSDEPRSAEEDVRKSIVTAMATIKIVP